MKKTISVKGILIVFLSLLGNACIGQTKNEKTEPVKIYGNCGMCKSTIEKAGNMKNLSNLVWDKETKMATISYDSLKTSKEDILKRIALAGYDSDMFLAPNDTYSNLPSCCQYKRAKQTIAKMDEPKMEMTTDDHSMHSNKMVETLDTNPLSAVYDSYFAVKDALVKTDWQTASTSSKTLFTTLSKNIYEVMKISKQETQTDYQFCPMANNGKGANWLSKESEIKNPYYGSQMLSCGKTVETIKE